MNGNSDTPRVWVGSLAAYNSGRLLGDWFDASSAPTDSRSWLDALIERGVISKVAPRYDADTGLDFSRVRSGAELESIAAQHEELRVFDHENFHGLLKGECSPAEAAELAQMLEDCNDPEAFALFAQNQGLDYSAQNWDATRESFEEAFCGWWESEADYAQELAEDLGATKNAEGQSWPSSCIDWQRAWGELRMGGDYWSEYVPGKGYAIFRSV